MDNSSTPQPVRRSQGPKFGCWDGEHRALCMEWLPWGLFPWQGITAHHGLVSHSPSLILCTRTQKSHSKNKHHSHILQQDSNAGAESLLLSRAQNFLWSWFSPRSWPGDFKPLDLQNSIIHIPKFVLQRICQELPREVERGWGTGQGDGFPVGRVRGTQGGDCSWDGIPRAAPASLARWKCPCHGAGMSSRALPSPGAIGGGTGTARVPAGSQDCPLCLPSQPRLSQSTEMPFLISLVRRSCQLQSRDPAWSWGSVPSSALAFSWEVLPLPAPFQSHTNRNCSRT